MYVRMFSTIYNYVVPEFLFLIYFYKQGAAMRLWNGAEVIIYKHEGCRNAAIWNITWI